VDLEAYHVLLHEVSQSDPTRTSSPTSTSAQLNESARLMASRREIADQIASAVEQMPERLQARPLAYYQRIAAFEKWARCSA